MFLACGEIRTGSLSAPLADFAGSITHFLLNFVCRVRAMLGEFWDTLGKLGTIRSPRVTHERRQETARSGT